MEAVDESLGYNSYEHSHCDSEFAHPTIVAKGKRTKRQRSHQLRQSQSIVITGSSSDSSTEISESVTEEDEHMANCLILLAQGHTFDAGREPEAPSTEEATGVADGGKYASRRYDEAAATDSGKGEFCVYVCKTCNKCFPSFRALGGHLASHKKPKLSTLMPAEEKKATAHDDSLQILTTSFSMPVNTKSKIHECSICGSGFSSGQALGGHMRRHRPVVVPENQQGQKGRSLLPLDLNLPVPADDERDEAQIPSPPLHDFALAGKLPVVLPPSVSVWVDCHY
ncbi:hypothetical protein BHM03_00054854 [Ensete ventricosum]|nr:hypothetical protein BHM03_00054854 [Ensete ventricosum]